MVTPPIYLNNILSSDRHQYNERKSAKDKSCGIHSVGGSKGLNSLILCHSEGMAWFSLDLPLKSKRLIVVNEKGSSKWMGEEYERREGLLRCQAVKLVYIKSRRVKEKKIKRE